MYAGMQPLKFVEVGGQARMLEWLSKSSARFNKLGVAQLGDEYRGVVAKEENQVLLKPLVKKDQILLSAQVHMITLEMAKKDCGTSRKLLEQDRLDTPQKHTFLSLLLLDEKAKQDSFWKEFRCYQPATSRSRFSSRSWSWPSWRAPASCI